jgi:putative NIF3 family GTP cyclohydrolase 1 type 2
MEDIAPTRFAARWDNVGLLVGDAEQRRHRRPPDHRLHARRPARGRGRGLRGHRLVPPALFEAQKRFVAGSLAFEAARAGVAVFSPHTALDVAEGGTNDVLADASG